MTMPQRRSGRRRREAEEPGIGPPAGAGELRCSRGEVQALDALAGSTSAGVWRIKRAKVILGLLAGRSVPRLMLDYRVPAKTIQAFLQRFAVLRMRAFDEPDRRPTQREQAVERMLAFLEAPPPRGSPGWKEHTVHYIGRDYTAEEVHQLRTLVRERPDIARAVLARELCQRFGLVQANGRLRKATASDVVRRMAMDNLVVLAANKLRQRQTRRPRPRQVPGAEPPGHLVTEVGALSFVPVRKGNDSMLWREYLRAHHYIETTQLVGAQMRYLVFGMPPSAAPGEAPDREGVPVGVLGFGAAAWRVAGRDAFIGWNDEQRVRNLNKVVANARFLILPWVRVRNLASRILGGIARRLPADWEERYGYRPVLLETFVQLDRFTGACYRAANWVDVGETKGYSLLGAEHRASAPRRAVLLYPLRRDFRTVLCDEGGAPAGPLERHGTEQGSTDSSRGGRVRP